MAAPVRELRVSASRSMSAPSAIRCAGARPPRLRCSNRRLLLRLGPGAGSAVPDHARTLGGDRPSRGWWTAERRGLTRPSSEGVLASSPRAPRHADIRRGPSWGPRWRHALLLGEPRPRSATGGNLPLAYRQDEANEQHHADRTYDKCRPHDDQHVLHAVSSWRQLESAAYPVTMDMTGRFQAASVALALAGALLIVLAARPRRSSRNARP
jgi:hypothetical protein